jgi:hypothetical protein
MDVFLNGVLLDPNSDYTATNGTSVVLTSGASAGDLLEVIAFDSFSVFSGTFGGDVTVGGDLLVGKTALTLNTEGHALTPTYARFTRDGAAPVQFNRTTSDGDIVSFYKDGSTMGSIGSRGSTLYVGRDDTNLKFVSGTDKIHPATTEGADRDNAIDLGDASARFKDLYLSGGAFLGGTGSANHLDDYEEGTWTATIGNGTVNGSNTRYVKIGKQVTLWGYLQTFSDRSTASSVNIGGLPFTSAGDNFSAGATFHRYINALGDSLTAYIPASTNTMTFYTSNQNSAYTNVLHSQLSSTSTTIFFTISYRV